MMMMKERKNAMRVINEMRDVASDDGRKGGGRMQANKTSFQDCRTPLKFSLTFLLSCSKSSRCKAYVCWKEHGYSVPWVRCGVHQPILQGCHKCSIDVTA